MSETREKTKKQLRRILSIAFSLDAAMEEFMNDITTQDNEGEIVCKTEEDLDAWLSVSEFYDKLQDMTYDLHTVILQNYEYRKEADDE
ncbi:MAG: hypothetical protein NC311_12775 [Muribaculaceae bacterium]|nr:hypothetical protein [Muribaculaceae bacterium]